MDIARAPIERSRRASRLNAVSGVQLPFEARVDRAVNADVGLQSGPPAEPGWRPSLEQLAEPERGEILVISDALPTPDQDSGSFRLYELLRILSKMASSVTFIADSDREPERSRYASLLRQLGIRVLCGREVGMQHLVANGRRYASVFLSRPEVAFAYVVPGRATAIHATVIYDTVDLHWMRLSREATLLGSQSVATQAERFQRMERFNIAACDVAVTVTEEERAVIQALEPSRRVELIPNIHPTLEQSTPWQSRRGLIFVGGFWHRPNLDAVVYFVQEILPRVHRQLPDATFTVIGSHMPDSIKSLESPSIRCVGHVADLAPHFSAARVFVAPLRYGAGMKGKIGQSISYGVPVVTSTVGSEGLMLVHGENAMIADTPERFADSIVHVYHDESLWTSISNSARLHIARHFSVEAVRPLVERVFARPLKQARARSESNGDLDIVGEPRDEH